jgi:hypothetical protein
MKQLGFWIPTFVGMTGLFESDEVGDTAEIPIFCLSQGMKQNG